MRNYQYLSQEYLNITSTFQARRLIMTVILNKAKHWVYKRYLLASNAIVIRTIIMFAVLQHRNIEKIIEITATKTGLFIQVQALSLVFRQGNNGSIQIELYMLCIDTIPVTCIRIAFHCLGVLILTNTSRSMLFACWFLYTSFTHTSVIPIYFWFMMFK